MNRENELLVVSFGTTSAESRRLNIESVERAIGEAAGEDWQVCRCFTSQTIINIIARREGCRTDNIAEALERAEAAGVRNLAVQPTHLMKGLEYDKLCRILEGYADSFGKVAVGDPLLTSDDDFKRVEKALTEWTAEYDDGKTAIVFMGHGTEADSNGVYAAMQELMTEDGHDNYFIGTVEAEPSLEDVLALVKEGSYERVVLEPMMVVAGDHANNDMAGDEDGSWKRAFEAEGYEVTCLLRGLGENEDIQNLYIEHLKKALEG